MHVDSTHIIKDNLNVKMQHRKQDFLFFRQFAQCTHGRFVANFFSADVRKNNGNAAGRCLASKLYHDSCPDL